MQSKSNRPLGPAAYDVSLWFGLLGSPVIFLVLLQYGFSAARSTCARGDVVPLLFAGSLFLLGTFSAFLICWSHWRRACECDQSSVAARRVRFTALTGIWISILFTLAVAWLCLAIYSVSPCIE